MERKKDVKKYKAIIFDLDGTLINSLPYHFLAFKYMMQEHGFKVTDRYLKKVIGLPTELILKDLKKKYGFKENIHDLREERRYHYFKSIGNHDITFLGVNKTLKELKKKYKIAIATGSSKITFSHSTSPDFQKMFDIIVTIMDTQRGKPYPDPLLLASRKLGVRPSDCLMVGDSVFDALAAKRAKMNFIGVTTGFTKSSELKKIGAVRIIGSIKELKKVL